MAENPDRDAENPTDGEDHWIDAWPLDRRMMLTLALPVALLLAGGLYVALEVGDLDEMQTQQAEERRELRSAVLLDEAFSDVVMASQTYVMTGDTQNRSRLESRISTFETRLQEYRDPADTGSSGTVANMEENASAYIDVVRRAQDHVEEGDMERARALLTSSETETHRTNAQQALDALREAGRADVESQREEIVQAYEALEQSLLVGTLAAVLAIGLVGYDVTRRTEDTLVGETRALGTRLAKLDETRRETDRRVERVQETLAETRSLLAELTEQTASVEERVGGSLQIVATGRDLALQGDRRIEATSSTVEEADAHVGDFTDELLALSDQIDEVRSAADDVVTLADEVDMLALNASVSASGRGEPASGLDEVRERARQAQQRGERLQEIARSAREGSNRAAIAVERSGKAIEETRANVADASEWLGELRERLEDSLAQLGDLEEAHDRLGDTVTELDAALETSEEATEEMERDRERVQAVVTDLKAIAERLRGMS